MTNYAIIGCGYAGNIHADNVLDLSDGHLYGCYDTEPLRASAMSTRTGAVVYNTAEELYQDGNVDAVIISTPNNMHTRHAIQCAMHKKHVFCEKPFALSVADTQSILQAAREAGIICLAGHVSRFIKGVGTARSLLEDGCIGDLLSIEAVHTDWAAPQPTVGWKQQKAFSGGHLYHHMHEVDIICSLLEPISRVYAQGENLAHKCSGCGDEEDSIMLNMHTEHGHMASLVIGSAFHLGDHYIKLHGSKGGIMLDFKNSQLRLEVSPVPVLMSMHENEDENNERRSEYTKYKTDAGKAFGRPGLKTSQWMQSIFMKELLYFSSLMAGSPVKAEYADLSNGAAALSCAKVLAAAAQSMLSGQSVYLQEGLL